MPPPRERKRDQVKKIFTHRKNVSPTQVHDLWSKALKRLPEEDKQLIQTWIPSSAAPPSSGADLLSKLCEQVKKQQTICEKNRWKFAFNGREVILYDVARKIIGWLDYFKVIGDTCMNFNPVHAALPWAGVRFLLQSANGSPTRTPSVLLVITNIEPKPLALADVDLALNPDKPLPSVEDGVGWLSDRKQRLNSEFRRLTGLTGKGSEEEFSPSTLVPSPKQSGLPVGNQAADENMANPEASDAKPTVKTALSHHPNLIQTWTNWIPSVTMKTVIHRCKVWRS
ncbi:hypothetical protein AOQ84DRAFT_383689 [Glonium stellatum]|uniref:Uncharacterized protein n=1 Tax=Glonium stellatum TaxID=574774 RepID=A0A8E2EMJ4_9PEZI|nr:hypothetical protein AOQ84DRAFT_383689 [Glonium stellatum]